VTSGSRKTKSNSRGAPASPPTPKGVCSHAPATGISQLPIAGFRLSGTPASIQATALELVWLN
jgi:hypothetical protein